jgi:hypothetical protein
MGRAADTDSVGTVIFPPDPDLKPPLWIRIWPIMYCDNIDL